MKLLCKNCGSEVEKEEICQNCFENLKTNNESGDIVWVDENLKLTDETEVEKYLIDSLEKGGFKHEGRLYSFDFKHVWSEWLRREDGMEDKEAYFVDVKLKDPKIIEFAYPCFGPLDFSRLWNSYEGLERMLYKEVKCEKHIKPHPDGVKIYHTFKCPYYDDRRDSFLDRISIPSFWAKTTFLSNFSIPKSMKEKPVGKYFSSKYLKTQE